MKAVFLDRDGTIIIDKTYQYKAHEIEYFQDTRDALKMLQDKGFELFMITNQSGINRRYFQVEDMHAVHQKIQDDLKKWGLRPFLAINFCPHTPDENCDCRKPKPKMLDDLIQKWNVDTGASYMVGDKVCDTGAAENAKLNPAMVYKTGFEPQFSNLLAFASSL
jgi:D-glycero-D-manno-heptose 1,7-bisphosphate phosphatase